MFSLLPQCPNCYRPLNHALMNTKDLRPCPNCSSMVQVEVFPALFRRFTPGRAGESVLVEGQSTCFFHPQKKAAVPCESCGRFLCALCDCELRGQHLCPTCLEMGAKKGKIKHLENQRTLYDNIALALVVYPAVTVVGLWLAILTAPPALFIAIRHWKASLGIGHRSRVRYVVAIVLALAELVVWCFILKSVFEAA